MLPEPEVDKIQRLLFICDILWPENLITQRELPSFLKTLKLLNVIPIFKSGGKQQFVNNRPISILCFSKT